MAWEQEKYLKSTPPAGGGGVTYSNPQRNNPSSGGVLSYPYSDPSNTSKEKGEEGITGPQALVLTLQQEEDFGTFTNRAQTIIILADIPNLSHDQVAILFFLDMLTNEILIKKIHENFREIIELTYIQALDRINLIHKTLMVNKVEGYDGKGFPTKKVVIDIEGVNKEKGKERIQAAQCSKCKSPNHITVNCKEEQTTKKTKIK